MNKNCEIVVGGIGLITCLGENIDHIWGELRNGASGIREITLFDTADARSAMGGEVLGKFPKDGFSRMKSFSKKAIYNAIIDSGLSVHDINNEKSVLVIGSSLGHLFQNELSPVELDNYIEELLVELNLNIPFISVSAACSSGGDSIAIGADLIEFQNYGLVICGGVDVLDVYKLMGHSSLQTLSATQCRPFSDVDYGTTLGEGAAFIILSDKATRKRAKFSKSYANLIGRSDTTDTVSVTNPDNTGYGAMRAIKQAIGKTGFSLNQISYINAHGSGTQTNDVMEWEVYKQLFSISSPFISSTKGAFGHTLGATGAIEAIVAILSIYKKEAPPNVGCIIPSKEWEGTGLVMGSFKKIDISPLVAISVTYGFGGANSCLVFSM
jgi:3-oxoacyl-[acyl-carrier-protein] synthase II